MKRNLMNLAALLSLCASAAAEVRLPNLFSDHMVLQRDKVIKVWGWADAGEKIKVVLSGKAADTTANADGGWRVELPAMKAGGPHELTVTGKNTVTIDDILVGEVWVCSGQSNMEFYYVQITPNNYGGALPLLLEAQNAAMAIPNTGMAASTDTCDPSDNYGGGHPRNKQEIGRRLALWALAKDYGKKDLVYRGPSWNSVKAEGATLRIGFDHVGSGLVTRDHKAPDYFEIAGADGEFVEAVAKIEGATVVISSDKVATPAAMRFAWKDLAQPNLMNREGLPVSVFRAEVGKKKD